MQFGCRDEAIETCCRLAQVLQDGRPRVRNRTEHRHALAIDARGRRAVGSHVRKAQPEGRCKAAGVGVFQADPLPSQVERHAAGTRPCQQTPTDPVARLQDDRRAAAFRQRSSRDESGDAGPDDDDLRMVHTGLVEMIRGRRDGNIMHGDFRRLTGCPARAVTARSDLSESGTAPEQPKRRYITRLSQFIGRRRPKRAGLAGFLLVWG